MKIDKSTTIGKIECPNCGTEVWSYEIQDYYDAKGNLKFACPKCGDK